MMRARSLRAVYGRQMSIRVFGYLIGNLLFRTMDRAQRIHLAMLSRGFEGEIRVNRPMGMKAADFRFMLVWTMLFLLFRFYNIPRLLGLLLTGDG